MKIWNGQFSSENVIEKIRKKIKGAINSDRTVLLDFDGVRDLPPEILNNIIADWPENQVKVILPGGAK